MTQRSHITQILQNYFDATDRRTRENPTTLEAQMLNLAGVELENLKLRISREQNQTLQTVPSNIDNGGVYYSSRVPDVLINNPDQTSFNQVVGSMNGKLTTLSLYNDTLPVPSRVEVDGDNIVALPNPILFSLIGKGDALSQVYAVQYVSSCTFPVPNRLTLWLDQMGLNGGLIILTITGETFPQPAWVAERRKTTEVVTMDREGVSYTRNRWAVIDSIAVRNLPVGARLRGWSIPFNLPAVPDPARPYSTPEDRDVLYPRYWQISNPDELLYEIYQSGTFTGMEFIDSYALSDKLVDVAVEPFTNGIFAASNNTLYYGDRREYQADLSNTGLTVEPLYGLQVVPDFSKGGPTRYVTLSAIPYANASSIYDYRYTVRKSDSLSALYSILDGGAFGPANAGWQVGTPKPMTFALVDNIDYEFRLEIQDINGSTTYDVVPYRNAAFSPLKTIDMSNLVDIIQGLAFDSYGQLWVWNGGFAIPIKIHYDAYVFDADSKSIFVTEPFDTLQIS